jgi:hypothetical protein
LPGGISSANGNIPGGIDYTDRGKDASSTTNPTEVREVKCFSQTRKNIKKNL